MTCYEFFNQVLSQNSDGEIYDLEQEAIRACGEDLDLYYSNSQKWMEDHIPEISMELLIEYYKYLLDKYPQDIYPVSPFILFKIIKMWFVRLSPFSEATIFILDMV